MSALNPQVSKRADGTIVMTWNPDTACFGYRFYRDGVAVAKGTKPTQAETTFKKETDGRQHSYGIARAVEQTPEEVKFPADPPPPTSTIKGSIAQGATLTGKVIWTADHGPCLFTIDAGSPWQEDVSPYVYGGDGATIDTMTLANGSHTFKVALVDGTAEHVVTATVQNANVPPPTGRVDGVGNFSLAGMLPSRSHIYDGTYDMVIGDWETASTVDKCSGLGFVYRNLGETAGSGGWHPIDLSNPDGFVAECVAMKKQYPGVDGIFLDNLNSWTKSTHLPFLQNVSPRLRQAGLMLMANAMASSSGSLSQDDGSADRAWYKDICPYLDYVFIEYWMMGRGGPLKLKLRLKGSATYADFWEGWIQNPKAIHDLGCKVCCDSYNGLSNAIYARASLLLVAGPGDVYCASMATSTPDGPDPYNPAWMKNMGAPIDPPVSAGVYTRRFANGVVSVDPVKGTAVIS